MNQRAAFDETLELAMSSGMPRLDGSEVGLTHLRDMRRRIEPGFSEAKLGRWLGWAQAALVAANIGVTLEDVKQLNLRHSEAVTVLPQPDNNETQLREILSQLVETASVDDILHDLDEIDDDDFDRETIAHIMWTLGAWLDHPKCRNNPKRGNDGDYANTCDSCIVYLQAVADSIILVSRSIPALAAARKEGAEDVNVRSKAVFDAAVAFVNLHPSMQKVEVREVGQWFWAKTEGITGQRIAVIEVNLEGVNYGGGLCYLDDRNGEGSAKVFGGGSPRAGHKDVHIVPGSFEGEL